MKKIKADKKTVEEKNIINKTEPKLRCIVLDPL